MLSEMNTIDLVTQEPDGSCGLVLLVEEAEWDAPAARVHLQEKVNAYAVYVVRGDIEFPFPSGAPRSFRIMIQSVDAFPSWTPAVFEQLAAQLQPHGIMLESEPLASVIRNTSRVISALNRNKRMSEKAFWACWGRPTKR